MARPSHLASVTDASVARCTTLCDTPAPPSLAGSPAELSEARRLVESHQRSLAQWEAGVAAQMQVITELQVGRAKEKHPRQPLTMSDPVDMMYTA